MSATRSFMIMDHTPRSSGVVWSQSSEGSSALLEAPAPDFGWATSPCLWAPAHLGLFVARAECWEFSPGTAWQHGDNKKATEHIKKMLYNKCLRRTLSFLWLFPNQGGAGAILLCYSNQTPYRAADPASLPLSFRCKIFTPCIYNSWADAVLMNTKKLSWPASCTRADHKGCTNQLCMHHPVKPYRAASEI